MHLRLARTIHSVHEILKKLGVRFPCTLLNFGVFRIKCQIDGLLPSHVPRSRHLHVTANSQRIYRHPEQFDYSEWSLSRVDEQNLLGDCIQHPWTSNSRIETQPDKSCLVLNFNIRTRVLSTEGPPNLWLCRHDRIFLNHWKPGPSVWRLSNGSKKRTRKTPINAVLRHPPFRFPPPPFPLKSKNKMLDRLS